jgi:hypothetical protein
VRLLNVPSGHVEQLLPFAGLYVPGEHGTQSIAPIWSVNVPAGHVEQLLLPFVELFVPERQNVQLIAPSGL